MLMNGIDYAFREAELEAAGIDPRGDDTEFGVDIVYCNQHMRPHSVGWCTVSNVEKFPLSAKFDNDDARQECRDRGYRLYRETEGDGSST